MPWACEADGMAKKQQRREDYGTTDEWWLVMSHSLPVQR
jgi:hypothetical protein